MFKRVTLVSVKGAETAGIPTGTPSWLHDVVPPGAGVHDMRGLDVGPEGGKAIGGRCIMGVFGGMYIVDSMTN